METHFYHHRAAMMNFTMSWYDAGELLIPYTRWLLDTQLVAESIRYLLIDL